MLDLDEITATAKAATPGEWKRLARWDGRVVTEERLGGEPVARGLTVADAAHIAAMSPATTLALVAELRAAREQLGEVEWSDETLDGKSCCPQCGALEERGRHYTRADGAVTGCALARALGREGR